MKVSFDDFVVDTETSQLTRQGIEIALEPRAFDLLTLLIRHRDCVVSRDEIIQQLWGGRFTSDAAIATCIRQLRKALLDDGEQQRTIRTQRGRGFRFVAKVTDLTKPVMVHPQADPSPSQSKLEPDNLSRIGKPSLIVLPLQCLDLQCLDLQCLSPQGQLPPHQDSVLAEAISHELIQALSRLRWMRVIARGTAFQFAMPNADLQTIGKQLSVRYALYGSLETLGKGWAITMELALCDSNEIVWSDRYEASAENVHHIRHDIIARVIASLEMYIPLHEANQALQQGNEHLDAWANYHLGLRHMYRFNQQDNQQATHYFQRALQRDPTFARAWGGLSFTRFQDAFVNYDQHKAQAIADAHRFAEKSVELDPLDPFTNFNMGRSYWLDGDSGSSLNWLQRAVTLSPNFAQGHYSCAFSEVLQGNVSQAMADSGKALDTSPLDPLLYAIYSVRTFSHLILNEREAAQAWAEKAALSPGAHYLIHMIAAVTHALAGNQTRATFWHDRTLRLKPNANRTLFLAAFPFVDNDFLDLLQHGLVRAGFI